MAQSHELSFDREPRCKKERNRQEIVDRKGVITRHKGNSSAIEKPRTAQRGGESNEHFSEGEGKKPYETSFSKKKGRKSPCQGERGPVQIGNRSLKRKAK